VNLRNLILDHVKNILCKFQFFWHGGSWEDF
jgi:hypothetical protein